MPHAHVDSCFFTQQVRFLLLRFTAKPISMILWLHSAVGPVPSLSISRGRAVHGLGNIYEGLSSAPSMFVSARICLCESVLTGGAASHPAQTGQSSSLAETIRGRWASPPSLCVLTVGGQRPVSCSSLPQQRHTQHGVSVIYLVTQLDRRGTGPRKSGVAPIPDPIFNATHAVVVFQVRVFRQPMTTGAPRA
jgi:hypothetical protein